MKSILRILFIEDSEEDAFLVLHQMKKGGYDIEYERVETAEGIRAALKEKSWDIIFSDYEMPQLNGLEALAILKESGKDIPLIVISGRIGEDIAVETMRNGARDYIMKGNWQRLLPAVERELHESKIRIEQSRLELKQKQAEAHLNLQSLALEAAANCIIITDKNGTILWANQALTELTGYTVEEAIGQNTRIFKSGVHNDKFYATLWQTILSGKVWCNEFVNRRKDGTFYTEEMTITPVKNSKAEITNFIAVKQNVTDRKQIEAELKKSRDLLEERVKERTAELAIAKEQAESATTAKSMFLANMSHEIRTPMNAVFGYSSLALRTALTAEQSDYINRIKKSSTILLEIINDILDFSKIEAGKLEIEKRKFRPGDILEDLADIFTRQAADKNIELIIGADHKIPELLIGDSGRVRQILINLTSNALKFTPSGEVFIHATLIKEHEDRSTLCFHVKDTGIGISREHLNVIFSAFSQVDGNITRKFGGTGLGLAISKNLADIMGGEIQVTSKPGRGSTFSLIVPFEKPTAVPVFPYTCNRGLKGKKVLVADDNTNCRKVLTGMMTSFGLQVTEAGSGEEVLRRVEKQADTGRSFDLLVIDWKMPPPNGLEVSQMIRKDFRYASIPIILISGFPSEFDGKQVADIGINAFLVKPVKPSVIFETLMQVFGKKSMDTKRGPKDVLNSGQKALVDLKGAHVLLAEDNEINQDVVLKLLEEEGITADVAANGKDVLKAAMSNSYDAILMDIQMPEMDGYEATRQFRAFESKTSDPSIDTKKIQSPSPAIPRIPIIAMTAHAMQGDREKCLEVGMDDYISKPVEPDLLLVILEKWIGRKPKSGSKGPNRRKSDRRQSDRRQSDRRKPDTGKPKAYTVLSHPAGDSIPDSLPSLAGINVSEGLRRLRGDIPLFRMLLKQFVKKYADVSTQLNDALKNGDLSRIKHLAHTLKGTAGNISAKKLQTIAGQLETAALNPNNSEDEIVNIEINEKINQVEQALAQVLESVGRLDISEKNLSGTTADSDLPQQLNLSEIKSILSHFSQCLANHDPEAEDLLESAVKHLTPWKVEDECRTMTSQINEFDFKGALTTLKQITNRIGIQLE